MSFTTFHGEERSTSGAWWFHDKWVCFFLHTVNPCRKLVILTEKQSSWRRMTLKFWSSGDRKHLTCPDHGRLAHGERQGDQGEGWEVHAPWSSFLTEGTSSNIHSVAVVCRSGMSCECRIWWKLSSHRKPADDRDPTGTSARQLDNKARLWRPLPETFWMRCLCPSMLMHKS